MREKLFTNKNPLFIHGNWYSFSFLQRIFHFLFHFLLFLPYMAWADVEVSHGPYFWQIEKDGKSSYVLGTMHDNVVFEELQCHQEIKGYLVSADFLLTEVPRYISNLYELEELFHNRQSSQKTQNSQGLYSLSPSALDFFTKKVKEFEEAYYQQYGEYLPLGFSEAFYKEMAQASYFQMENFIRDICHYPFIGFLDFIDYHMDKEFLYPSDSEDTSIGTPSDLEVITPASLLQNSSSTKNLLSIKSQSVFHPSFQSFSGNIFSISLDEQILDMFLDQKQKVLNLDENLNLWDQYFSPTNSYIKQEKAMDLLDVEWTSGAMEHREAEKEVWSQITQLIDQILSSGEELNKLVDHIASSREELSHFIDRLPKPLQGKELLVDQFITPLDDLTTIIIRSFIDNSISQKEDIEEWIYNFDERCSEDQLEKIYEDWDPYVRDDTLKKDFIQGLPLNIDEEYFFDEDQNPGFLETEIKREMFFLIKYIINFRNERWRSKIIKAHSQHNSIFVAGGVAHFMMQDRNPINLKALEQYVQDNQALPFNVLGMLKQEGFTVKRMSADCSFE